MPFSKPPLKYTQMAEWIDSNAQNTDVDTEKLYTYLYHLILMQAHQVVLFKSQFEKYEDFAFYGASRLFMRLTTKKPIKYRALDGQPYTSGPIKSILNYIKGTITFLRADFEVECNGYDPNETIKIGSADISSYLVETASHFDKYSYTTGVYELCNAAVLQLQKIPYKKHSPEWVNIYISCLLTFLDSLTIENVTKEELKSLYNNDLTAFRKLFEKGRNKPPVLFHVNENMSNYIKVLVQEIRHALTAEIRYETETNMSVDAMVKQLMIDALTNNDDED